jgi:hypothetical protein
MLLGAYAFDNGPDPFNVYGGRVRIVPAEGFSDFAWLTCRAAVEPCALPLRLANPARLLVSAALAEHGGERHEDDADVPDE